jgi:hypothetical protein
VKKDYPDISSLLEAKERRRRELAALSWEEKVAIIEQMNRLLSKETWKQENSPIILTNKL